MLEASERLVGSPVFKTGGGSRGPRRVRFPSASAECSSKLCFYAVMTERHVRRERRRLTATVTDLGVRRQRALLVGVGNRDPEQAEASLDELARLADTAGSDAVDRVLQQRSAPDPATYLGKGKAAELAAWGAELDVDVVIVDGELSPVQQRSLQEIFSCDVVDRVGLILDIFAQHATSRAGMAQVELALLRYRLPRLRGRGIEMSRLAGGIGTRGPGETQLETDRRRVLKRISVLERQIAGMRTTRATQQKARRRSGLPTVALVGYTNSGKSSLLNRLTGAAVHVENRLFSTLDTTVRRLDMPSGRTALLSDTVGFVRDLPHELVEAFRSTLEEAVATDLLLHVVDAAAPEPDLQIAAVHTTLAEIGGNDRRELLVANKIDIAPTPVVERLLALHPDGVATSATEGGGLADLVAAIDAALAPPTVDMELFLPRDRSDLVAALHRIGEVLAENHEETGIRMKVRLPHADAGLYLEYMV
jgi:GTP-binding protein HflX